MNPVMEATAVAETIRAQIREETQLTASAGVAPNKFLAKIASDWRKPDGLCDEAWKAIHHYAMTLVHDGGNFYGGGWLKDNIAVCACNDGIRPVIFKLEPVEG